MTFYTGCNFNRCRKWLSTPVVSATGVESLLKTRNPRHFGFAFLHFGEFQQLSVCICSVFRREPKSHSPFSACSSTFGVDLLCFSVRTQTSFFISAVFGANFLCFSVTHSKPLVPLPKPLHSRCMWLDLSSSSFTLLLVVVYCLCIGWVSAVSTLLCSLLVFGGINWFIIVAFICFSLLFEA